MNCFDFSEVSVISRRFRAMIMQEESKNQKLGVILSYSQMCAVVDRCIISEGLLADLSRDLLEHDIILIHLGPAYVIMDFDEVTKYEKISEEDFVQAFKTYFL